MRRKGTTSKILEDNTITILELDRRGVNASAIAKIYDVTAPTIRAFIERKTGENNTNETILKDN